MLNSENLDKEENRLNSGFYISTGERKYGLPIKKSLDESLKKIQNFNFQSLGDLSKEINLINRFKRIYVSSPKFGFPFLSGTNITQFNADPNYISKIMHKKNINNYIIHKNDILITRSGTVGNLCLVWDDWDGWTATEHTIRIRINPQKINFGYVFAFLNTEYAQSQIMRYIHGSVVDEITDSQLSNVLIPRLREDIEKSIHNEIIEAHNKYTKARTIISKNIDELANILNNQNQKELKNKLLKEIYIILPSNILLNEEFRLNAGFFLAKGKRQFGFPANITLDDSINIISKFKNQQLGLISKKIILIKRFKRHYVESADFGYVFMSGKNITQFEPSIKYLSSILHKKDYNTFKINKKWILITCSGTIGRIGLVWDDWSGRCLTQHVIRIIVDENKIEPGYLFTFLNTEHAQAQLMKYIHGSVVDEITDKQVSNILIPRLDEDLEKKISSDVYNAFILIEESRTLIRKNVSLISELLENRN